MRINHPRKIAKEGDDINYFYMDNMIKTNRFKKGKKYMIRRNGSKNNESKFCGTLIDTYERFYLFESEHGYRECFLKIDIEMDYYEVKRI